MPRWLPLILVAIGACSNAEEPKAEARAEAPTTAEPDVEAEPAGPPPLEGKEVPLSVKESLLLGNIPSKEAATLAVLIEDDELALHLDNLNTDCGPVPAFEARLKGDTLALRLTREGDRRWCTGPHSMKLRVDVPSPKRVERVRIEDEAGRLIAAHDASDHQ